MVRMMVAPGLRVTRSGSGEEARFLTSDTTTQTSGCFSLPSIHRLVSDLPPRKKKKNGTREKQRSVPSIPEEKRRTEQKENNREANMCEQN